MQAITWALSVVVALFIGGFLKSYMGKKGENLASREDVKQFVEEAAQKAGASKAAEIRAIQQQLELVVEQNTRIVQSSEEIKQRFTSEQKLWELKKEAIYDVVRRIGRMQHLVTTFGTESANYHKDKTNTEVVNKMTGLQEQIMQEIGIGWSQDGIVDLLFDPELSNAVKKVSSETMGVVRSMLARPPKEIIAEIEAWAFSCGVVLAFFRKELLWDIDPTTGKLVPPSQS